MSKMIEVPFEVIKVGIRQSVVLKRWYKRYLQKNKPPVEVKPEPVEEVTEDEVDYKHLKRNELVKFASSLGVEKSNIKSNDDLYEEIESIILGEENADNNTSGS